MSKSQMNLTHDEKDQNMTFEQSLTDEYELIYPEQYSFKERFLTEHKQSMKRDRIRTEANEINTDSNIKGVLDFD